MTRMIVSFDHPSTATVDMTTLSIEARRPSDAAKDAMEIGRKTPPAYRDKAEHTETVLGRDGRYWRGYRREGGPAGTEVWVRR